MKIFISYRRRDDPNFAWRLRDQCARHLGDDNIFFDIDSVYFGADFVETIRRMITQSDCMLVAIGPAWQPGRLANEEDYVRMEVLEAAQQRKLLIPVLNGDTVMPAADVLPPPLQFLARRNAATVQPDHFDRDVSALIKQIKVQVMPQPEPLPPPEEPAAAELVRSRVPCTEGSERTLLGHLGPVLALGFDATGATLASGGSDNTDPHISDVASGAELQCVTAKGGRVCGVALSGDGADLLSTSSDVIHRWQADTGRRRGTLAGHTGSVWGLALSPDATAAATASADNTAGVWDLASAQRRLTLRGHTGWVTTVAFAPGGELLATGSTDDACRVWDPESGRPIWDLRSHSRSVTSVAFSSDRRRMATASADGTGLVWDLATGRDGCPLEGHRGSVTSVAFTRDGGQVITGGVDGSCRAWDPTTGEPLHAYVGHTDRVHAVAISPDGRTLATAGADAAIHLWSLGS